MTGSEMFLTGDLYNLLRGLAAAAAAMPPGQFRDGYEAALVAVGLSCGISNTTSTVVSFKWDDQRRGVFTREERLA